METLLAGEVIAASCSDDDCSPQHPVGIEDDADNEDDDDGHSTSGGGMRAEGGTSRRSLSIVVVVVRRNKIRDEVGKEKKDGRRSNPSAMEEEEVQRPCHLHGSRSTDREEEVGWGDDDDQDDKGRVAARSRSHAMGQEDHHLCRRYPRLLRERRRLPQEEDGRSIHAEEEAGGG